MLVEKCTKCGSLKTNEPEARICDHEWIEEERYEHIDILVKRPDEGDSWFGRIFDLISEKCDSVQIDPDDEDSDWTPCSCGMQSMGGSEGTIDQCYEYMRISEKWAQDVLTDDLKLALFWLNEHGFPTKEVADAYERLRKAAYWHDDFNDWVANLPDDDEEEENEEWELPEEYLPYFSNDPIPDPIPGWEDDGGN